MYLTKKMELLFYDQIRPFINCFLYFSIQNNYFSLNYANFIKFIDIPETKYVDNCEDKYDEMIIMIFHNFFLNMHMLYIVEKRKRTLFKGVIIYLLYALYKY